MKIYKQSLCDVQRGVGCYWFPINSTYFLIFWINLLKVWYHKIEGKNLITATEIFFKWFFNDFFNVQFLIACVLIKKRKNPSIVKKSHHKSLYKNVVAFQPINNDIYIQNHNYRYKIMESTYFKIKFDIYH
jgi:hypothetical protein